MKKMLLSLGVACALYTGNAAEIIALPQPKLDSSATVAQAMLDRHTTRDFSPIDPAQKMQFLSDLLWCANGQNRPDGKRVTPAAIARYAASVYVADEHAVYRFDRIRHQLVEIGRGNYLTACASNTKMCQKASFALLFVIDETVWADRNRQDYAALEIGAMMQNVYLGCAALHLGTCACGSFNADQLAPALALEKNQKLYLIMLIGGETK